MSTVPVRVTVRLVETRDVELRVRLGHLKPRESDGVIDVNRAVLADIAMYQLGGEGVDLAGRTVEIVSVAVPGGDTDD